MQVAAAAVREALRKFGVCSITFVHDVANAVLQRQPSQTGSQQIPKEAVLAALEATAKQIAPSPKISTDALFIRPTLGADKTGATPLNKYRQVLTTLLDLIRAPYCYV